MGGRSRHPRGARRRRAALPAPLAEPADDRQVMTFALYRFGLNLGATVAPLLGLGLFYLAGHQFDLVFWGEALIALCYAVLAWVALSPKAKDQDRQQKSDAGPADRRRTESAGLQGRSRPC